MDLETTVDPDSHTALGHLKERGRVLRGKQVLFVSSISGLVAMSPQNQAAYNASKAALTMMAKVNKRALQIRFEADYWHRVSLENGHL